VLLMYICIYSKVEDDSINGVHQNNFWQVEK
jgi:bacterioferritin-associated ferredoxin